MIKWLAILGAGVLLSGCAQQPASPADNQDAAPTSVVFPTEAEEPLETEPAMESNGTESGSLLTQTGAIKEFTVEGSSFKFAPTIIRVKSGDIVKVTFKNIEGIHDFVIDEFKVATKQIAGGKSETVEFVADKAGTYEYYCSVGQHRKNGMLGKLIVE